MPKASPEPPLIHIALARQDPAPGPAVSVVDDDIWVSESLTELLAVHGWDARAYASGADFLGDERHRQAGCLIIDQHMPQMNGLDVVQTLRDTGVGVPTILITGRITTEIVERAGKLGVKAVLDKPFSVARLIELVRQALRERS